MFPSNSHKQLKRNTALQLEQHTIPRYTDKLVR